LLLSRHHVPRRALALLIWIARLLIDAGHRRWILGTSLAAVVLGGLYGWLNHQAAQALTGGTTVGLWYGVLGTLLMIYAGLLSAHRRLARTRFVPRRSWMLKGHIWLGLLSFWLILCHSGFHWGGTLEQILWLVFGAVVLSGIAGLVLQGVLPRLMTERVPIETPYEQMPYVCQQLTRRAAQLVEAICGAAKQDRPTARSQLRAYYEDEIKPFLAGAATATSSLPDTGRARERFEQFLALPDLAAERSRLQELEQLCDQRRQIAVQERLHHWLHGWLVLHVPLSLALLVLAVAHIVMSLYY
jgi:hypothetical protein